MVRHGYLWLNDLRWNNDVYNSHAEWQSAVDFIFLAIFVLTHLLIKGCNPANPDWRRKVWTKQQNEPHVWNQVGSKNHGAAEHTRKCEGIFSGLAHMQRGYPRFPERVGLVKINSVAYSYAHPVGQGAFGKLWKVLRHSDKYVNI